MVLEGRRRGTLGKVGDGMGDFFVYCLFVF